MERSPSGSFTPRRELSPKKASSSIADIPEGIVRVSARDALIAHTAPKISMHMQVILNSLICISFYFRPAAAAEQQTAIRSVRYVIHLMLL